MAQAVETDLYRYEFQCGQGVHGPDKPRTLSLYAPTWRKAIAAAEVGGWRVTTRGHICPECVAAIPDKTMQPYYWEDVPAVELSPWPFRFSQTVQVRSDGFTRIEYTDPNIPRIVTILPPEGMERVIAEWHDKTGR